MADDLFLSSDHILFRDALRAFVDKEVCMEYPVQRYFRDARFLLYGEGTSDIQKMIIARELGL